MVSEREHSQNGTDQPHPIEVRRSLRQWAVGQPQHIRDLVWTICGQLYAREREITEGGRKFIDAAIEKNMQRLGA